jgi:hypothetical protein
MHQRGLICWIAVLFLAACGGGYETDQPSVVESGPDAAPAEIRVENVGFTTPESVLHDPAADVYLVSNINGSPLGVDGNGFISRLSPVGTVIDLKWIDGENPGTELNAPKGMAIVGDTLFAADISVVRRFDRVTGEYLGAVEVPGSTFVNDLAATRDGRVIVSDSGMVFTENGAEPTGSAAVYIIDAEGALTTVAAGDALDLPNGVLDSRTHDGIVAATAGGAAVYLLDGDGERLDIATLPTGGLDGLVETDDGRLLVSSWEGSAVYAISPSGEITTVADNLPAPADIGWDAGRGLLLVPLFNDNAVVILSVSPATAVAH